MTTPEVITVLTAVGALIFTSFSVYAVRDQATAQPQDTITDRYTKAVELLDQSGPDHLQRRLGAIYALEGLARDSSQDQPTIIEVLSAFVRTSRSTPITSPGGYLTCSLSQPITPDVKAALTVLGRRNHTHDNGTRTDLTNTCLNGTDLSSADLRGVVLSDADLRGAVLSDADLRGAVLSGANLRSVDLSGSNLNSADLSGSDLSGANLSGADLRGANLRGVINDAGTVIDNAVTDPTTVGQWW